MTDDKKQNPWLLTPRECTVLAALIEHGNNKAAARALHLVPKTVETLSRLARDKMRKTTGSQTLSRLQAAVHFDRWVRAQ